MLVEAAHVHVTNTSLKAKQNTGTFVKLHAVPQSAGSGEGGGGGGEGGGGGGEGGLSNAVFTLK